MPPPTASPDLAHFVRGLSSGIAASLSAPDIELEVGAVREFPYSRAAMCNASARGRSHAIVIKIFKGSSGRLVERSAEQDARECFDKLSWLSASLPFASGYTVPRPLALFESSVAMETAPGLRLDRVFTQGSKRDRTAGFYAAGAWLAALSRVTPPTVPARELFAAEAASLSQVLDGIAGFAPDRAVQISRWRELVLRLAARAEAKLAATTPVWCHGDFIAINIYFRFPGPLTVIDVDGARPGFWPRDLASLRYDLLKQRFTSLTGLRRASACFRAVVEGRGLTPTDLQNDEFRFYWGRELLGNLHNLLRTSAQTKAGIKNRYMTMVTERMIAGLMPEKRG